MTLHSQFILQILFEPLQLSLSFFEQLFPPPGLLLRTEMLDGLSRLGIGVHPRSRKFRVGFGAIHEMSSRSAAS